MSTPEQIHQAALEYAALDLQIVPVYGVVNGICECREGANCDKPGKHPRIDAWQKKATSDENTVAGWCESWPNLNIGVQLGEKSGIIDIEADDEEAEKAIHPLFGGEAPYTPTYQSKRGKHRLVRWRADLPFPEKAGFKIGNLEFRTGGGKKGQQSVFPPSNRADGALYQWLIPPGEVDFAEIDDATLDRIKKKLKEPKKKNAGDKKPETKRSKLFTEAGQQEGGRDDAIYAEAVAYWGDLVRGRGAKVLTDDSVYAEVLSHLQGLNATKCHPPLDEFTVRQKVDSAKRFHEQEQEEFAEFDPAADDGQRWTSIRHDEGRTSVAFSRRVLRGYGDIFLWVPEWNSWLIWDGTRWKVDTGDCGMMRLSQAVSDAIWQEVAGFHSEDAVEFAQKMSSPSAWKTALKAAAAMRVVPVAELDVNPMLLNCQNQTVDLRTGKGRPHNQADRITKLCATEYDPTAKCPTWEKFVRDVFAESGALVAYSQKLCGWWLTGLIQEHLLHIAHGIGGNGKSTFFNAFLDTVGRDYAMQAPPDLLMEKKGESHPTERADLFGMRLVVASETSGGARLAESLVKQLTGGDKIRARRMRENFWEFDPTHKLVLLTNHKPRVRGQDLGIWRRLRLLPFNQVFIGDRADKGLPERLKAESPGILRWCVEGCQAWQKEGLTPPPEVRAATDEYQTSQDVLGRFVVECCEFGSTDFEVRFSNLYGGLENWCDESGENCPSRKSFGQWLEEQGYKRFRSNGIKYKGITLKA